MGQGRGRQRACSGLKNRSHDQYCPIEGTPLSRCESYRLYVQEDKELNQEYKALIKALSKDDVAVLRKMQRSWLDWRLDKCDEVDQQANCDNGVCAGVAHDECIVALTAQRVNELSRFRQNVHEAKSNNFNFSKKYDF
nr:lysozyme inhibitor LprI family protein [Duganella callida]